MFRKLWVLSFVAVLLLAACAPASNVSTGGSVPATGKNVQNVKISNFAFDPVTITVPVGTTIMWTNADSTNHTVTADDKSFDSGSLAQGKSFSQTFSKEGTFAYHCSFHPTMTAKVIVTK